MHAQRDQHPPSAVHAAAPAGIDRRWLHDLRNAVNTASVASAVARRMLEADMLASASDMLSDLEHACARCSSLLAVQPVAGAVASLDIDPAGEAASPVAGAPAPGGAVGP